MRLLVYGWNSYLQHDIFEILRERGIAWDVFPWQFCDKNADEAFEQWFASSVDASRYDALLSVNYWPMLSKACMAHSLKYLAWCYDAPFNVEHVERTIGNPANYVFCFDRVQAAEYQAAGFDTVRHLPLGVNAARMKRLRVSERDRRRYRAEVSFVGNLYDSELPAILSPLAERTRGYLAALMDAQSRIYGSYLLDGLLAEELLEDINRQYVERQPDTRFRLSKAALNFAMASEITRRDRVVLLNLCGRRFDTKFYCYRKSGLLKGVKECGGADYISEMPSVFACSKVNLNPSLRIIRSGIPLRAFDIMGAGGFLLSNWQEELCELYEDGREMAVYESLEDAVEKADFYLRHEDARAAIAGRGREKTLREHSLQDRLGTILKAAGLV